MEKDFQTELTASIRNFSLPKYNEIPNVGLFLEQTSKYISDIIAPLPGITITGSMISNYVKKGLIPSPVKKQYYADQIAYLFFISIAKQVLSMENIIALSERQRKTYSIPVAYDYFCLELENMLYYIFGLTDSVKEVGVTNTHEKTMLRSLIIAAAQIIYLDRCLAVPEAE